MNTLRNILEFPKHDSLFQAIGDECPEILLNIEVLFGNKLALDRYYHYPKDFIIQCNNILGNMIYFTEFAKKAKTMYSWLHNGITELLEQERETLCMLRVLRNSALHHKLIVPEDAFSFGLYRILNKAEYKLKVGLGDDRVKNNVPDHFLYIDTAKLFHKLLSLHFVYFIDIDHTALDECLGITRRWHYNVTYKYNGTKVRKTIDLYESINDFCDHLVNAVRAAFSKYKRLKYTEFTISNKIKHNYVNTLLELDLYPNLFDKWWNNHFEPLNFSSLLDYLSKREIDKRHRGYEKIYEGLPQNFEEYIARLKRYEDIQIEYFNDQEEYNSYVYFVSLHHWYLSRVFRRDFVSNNFNFSLITQLLDLSNEYIDKVDSNFDAFSNQEKNKYLQQIGNQLNRIRIEIERVLPSAGEC